mgnify:FL=1
MRVEYVKNGDSSKRRIMTTKREEIIQKIISYVVLSLLALTVIIPFYILIVSAFKPMGYIGFLENPSPFSGLNLNGFIKAFKGADATIGDNDIPTILVGLLNTLIITIPSTLGGLFISALSAYAFAKTKFKGRNVLFFIMLITTMIPGIVMMTPLVSIYTTLGLYNTLFPLIVPGMFGTAVCVFFLRQSFMAIPDDYIDAAKLDGIGHFRIFWKIVVPISLPSLVSQGILGFVAGYNDYLGPLLYLKGDSTYNITLQIALANFMGKSINSYQTLMAATVISLIPTVVIFIVCQKFFVKGITNSGLK